VWDSASPKFIMGGSDEEKFDHPTQKPIELMRRPILNHAKRGEVGLRSIPWQRHHAGCGRADGARVLWAGSSIRSTTMVVVQRWQRLTGRKQATLEGGRPGV